MIRPRFARIRRRPVPGADGYSLVELLITIALLGIVLGVVFDSLGSVTNSEAYQTDRTTNLDNMRTTLNQMTKLLRQGLDVTPGSSLTRLEFDTYVGGTATHILYTLDGTGTQLLEKVGSGPSATVLRNLVANPPSPLFCYTDASAVCGSVGGAATQWVQIALQVHPARSPNTTLELDSQVNLRNRTAA
jgi:prepilin-type N-terminal cleavage/methylation domain-containing protein